jgi:PAS domain S-box-containing protein
VESENKILIDYFKASNNPMWIIDTTTFSFLEMNEPANLLLGYSKEEFKNIKVAEIQFKDSYDSFVSILLNSNGQQNQQFETAFKTKNGEVLCFQFSIFALNYQQKKASLITLNSQILHKVHPINNKELSIEGYASKLNSYFDNSESVIILFDDQLKITAFNKQAENYAKSLFKIDLVIGENAIQILPELFKPRFNEYALIALGGIKIKNKVINIPNTLFWWSFQFLPYYTSLGEIAGVSLTANNITERKKTEDLLKIKESRFKSLTESGTDMISLYDKDFKTIYRSAAAFELTGRNDEELDHTKSILENLHPDDFTRLQAKIKKFVSTKGQKIFDRFRWRHMDGHYIWLEGTFTNLLHDENIRAIVSNMRNISEDIKLRESLSLLASIVDSTNDAVISCSMDGKITSWNKGAESLLGYTAQEVIGDLFKLFIPTDLVLYESNVLKKVRKGTYFNQLQTKRIKKNGEIIDVSLTMSPILNQTNEVIGISKIIRDITLRKKDLLEKELLIKELTNNNKELKQFSYITSHNLRGPVTNLIGVIQLLDLETITDPKTRVLIDAFKNSTTSLKTTLDDLIKILIIKENTNHEVTYLNLESHLIKVIDSIGNIIKVSGATIDFDFKAARTVLFNAPYLESIFLNLITNAIKYSIPGSKPHIRIKSIVKNDYVQIYFSDNGLGMAWEKVKDKIFGLYQRFHRHTDSKGIGLYLVHSQITSLGGSIEVKTEPNKGTTFIISFAPELM